MLLYKEKDLLRLVDDFSGKDEESFNKIARLISQDLVNIAHYYVANYEDAKDVCQEVLLKLYGSLASFRHASKISTWIYRVTVNACIDFLRKKKKVFSLEEKMLKGSKSSGQTIDDIEKKDEQRLIRRSIRKLSLRQKNAVILKHFEGLKISQISKILGCSESSVKTHLTRAIEILRKELGGQMRSPDNKVGIDRI